MSDGIHAKQMFNSLMVKCEELSLVERTWQIWNIIFISMFKLGYNPMKIRIIVFLLSSNEPFSYKGSGSSSFTVALNGQTAQERTRFQFLFIISILLVSYDL